MAVSAKSMGNLKRYEKGQTGNPNGRPRLPPDIHELKCETKAEIIGAVVSLMMKTPRDLQVILQDERTTVAKQLVGRMMITAMKESCVQRTQFLFNYAIGKPEKFENEQDPTGNDPGGEDDVEKVFEGIPTTALIQLVKQYKPQG